MAVDEAHVTNYLLGNFEWVAKDQPDVEMVESRVGLKVANPALSSEEYKGVVHVFYRHFKQKKPRGVIILFHGAGSSSVMYGPLANTLRKGPLNFDVIALDQFGHGRTSVAWNKNNSNSKQTPTLEPKAPTGPDCYLPDYHLLTDIGWKFINKLVCDLYKDRFHEKPVFLKGQSMGGAVLLSMMLDPPKDEAAVKRISGVILESPAIDVCGLPPAIVVGLLRGVSSIFPSLPSPSASTFDKDSRLAKMIHIRSTHPECFNSTSFPLITARELVTLFENVNNLLSQKKFAFPMLLLHGTSDSVIDIAGSKRLLQLNGHEDKTLIEYEGAYHSLIVDLCAKQFYEDIYQWLLKHA